MGRSYLTSYAGNFDFSTEILINFRSFKFIEMLKCENCMKLTISFPEYWVKFKFVPFLIT